MDLHFCPLTFLWFFSQFAILLHFGPLVPLSGFVPFWLAFSPQHLTLHTTWTYNKYQFTTKIYTEGGKNHSCHSFFPSLPCAPCVTLTSSPAAPIWCSTLTEGFLLNPSCLFWHIPGAGIWCLGEEGVTTSQGWAEKLPVVLQGSPARQSLTLPPLVLQFTFANSLGGKAEEQH